MSDFLNYTHREAYETVKNGEFYPQLRRVTPGSNLGDEVIEELLRNDNFCHGTFGVSYEP